MLTKSYAASGRDVGSCECAVSPRWDEPSRLRSAGVTFSMRSPVAMSNGCAPVLISYSAITLFTSSMSAVAGSYSRSALSPWDENVRILAVMFGLLRDVHLWSSVEQQLAGSGSLPLILHRLSGLSRLSGHSGRPQFRPRRWASCMHGAEILRRSIARRPTKE